MRQSGVLSQILPGADDRVLAPLVHFEGEAGLAPEAIRRLAALGGERVSENLRLSGKQSDLLTDLRDQIGSMVPLSELAYRKGADFALSAALLRAAVLEMPLAPDTDEQIAQGAAAVFPVAAKDLMPDLQGPALGAGLKRLEAEWIKSGFVLSKGHLLKSL